MKIAFVSQPWNRMSPPVQTGSIAILTYEAARRMAESHDVTVYAKRDPVERKIEWHDGVEYRRVSVEFERRLLRYAERVHSRVKPRQPLFSSPLYYLGYATKVANDLRKRKCDIVQLFNFSQFVPTIRAFNPRTKIVLRMSCEWLTQLPPGMIKPRLAKVDSIIGCSDFITEKIQHAFPEFADRCTTVLNGRDVAHFASEGGSTEKPDDGPKRLLFVGRVSPEKGVHVLLDAFERVLERFPNTSLDIIGPIASTPREFVLDLSQDPNVTGLTPFFNSDYVSAINEKLGPEARRRISFRGAVPHRELPREYCTADVFVFPSIWDEPSGNPPIEAMAAGVPVVSTRTGGTPEYVVDGTTGLLVDPGDSGQLAEAIVRLLENDGLRRDMGAAAQKHAANLFAYERFVEDLLKLYWDVCGQ